MKTVLVDPDAFRGDVVEIVGDAYRHLFRASRLAAGDELRLVDGQGHARHGDVRTITRRKATVVLGPALPDGEPRRSVAVWVPMPRPSRASWMVEKLTEVGVGAIRFYRSGRGPRQSGEPQIERLTRVAESAVEQSGRSRIPDLSGDLTWGQLLDEVRADFSVVLDPEAGTSSLDLPADADRVILVVGPEGGWSPEETDGLYVAASRLWRLGPTTLRVETAAVVGAARVVAGAG